MPQIKSGMIFLWSGAIGFIPGGYVLCDGNNGTPDLRDRFVMGAGGVFPVGTKAGSFTHTHDFTGDGHSHNLFSGTDIGAGSFRADSTSIDAATGTTDVGPNTPPFYSLAFIMKL